MLILAPLVTLANWVYEFEKWAVNDVENVIGEVYNISGKIIVKFIAIL